MFGPPKEPPDLDSLIAESDRDELLSRLSGFDSKRYKTYRSGLIDIFYMLSCSNAIRNDSKTISIQYFPKSSDVVNFYNDMYLLRLNRLAEILDPMLTHEKNPLNDILLMKSANLFSFMYETEKDDLMRKEFFHETFMRIRYPRTLIEFIYQETFEKTRSPRTLIEFIEDCKVVGQDVAAAESLAIEQNLYRDYIKK